MRRRTISGAFVIRRVETVRAIIKGEISAARTRIGLYTERERIGE